MKDAAVKTRVFVKGERRRGEGGCLCGLTRTHLLVRGPSMYMPGFPKGLIDQFSSALVIIHFLFGSVFLSTQGHFAGNTDALMQQLKATHGKE